MRDSQSSGKKVLITTSWDDGHRLDVRVAELLDKYNLRGTFYISPETRSFCKEDRLAGGQITSLSQRFEVGGHTRTHSDLSQLTRGEATEEISKGREFLEGVTGKQINSFCYPFGAFNHETPGILRQLGFRYARTVEQFCCGFNDAFEAGTTVHCLSHHYKNRQALKLFQISGFNPIEAWRCLDWSRLAMRLFDACLTEGGIFHLWGHSWEIEERKDWNRLERVFDYISNREEANYVTNGSLADSRNG